MGVLPNEVSKCSWFPHQARIFSILCNEGQMLAFTGVAASLQELLTLLEWGVAGVGGCSRHLPHPWPGFSDAPGSEPSPSRIACCSQPETWSLPHRGCRWSRLMEETRAVRHPQGQGEAAAWHRYQHMAGTHGRANGNGQNLLLTWALGNHGENTWPSG